MSFIQNRYTALVVSLFIWLISLYFIGRARAGKPPKIRVLPAIGAIDEAVGRTAEMGGRFMHVNGTGGLTSQETLSGLAVLRYVSENCAKNGVEVVVPLTDPVVVAAAAEAVRTAFNLVGQSEAYKEENIRYIGGSQWSLASGCMGILGRENIVSVTLVGAFAGEALAIVAAAAEAGCFQIGGCALNTTQMPWFVSLCDYAIIGEEVYALGAYLSQRPEQMGALAGQDVGKILSVSLIFVGIVMYLLGSKLLYNLIGM